MKLGIKLKKHQRFTMKTNISNEPAMAHRADNPTFIGLVCQRKHLEGLVSFFNKNSVNHFCVPDTKEQEFTYSSDLIIMSPEEFKNIIADVHRLATNDSPDSKIEVELR